MKKVPKHRLALGLAILDHWKCDTEYKKNGYVYAGVFYSPSETLRIHVTVTRNVYTKAINGVTLDWVGVQSLRKYLLKSEVLALLNSFASGDYR